MDFDWLTNRNRNGTPLERQTLNNIVKGKSFVNIFEMYIDFLSYTSVEL